MLSEDEIKKYQQIYKKEYSKEISIEDATEQANALYRLAEIMYE